MTTPPLDDLDPATLAELAHARALCGFDVGALAGGDLDALLVAAAREVAALEALHAAAVVRLRHVAARRAGAWVAATPSAWCPVA